MFNKPFSLKFLPIFIQRFWFILGNLIRYYYYYTSFEKIGKKVYIERNVSFGGIHKIKIDSNVSINQGCNLYGDYGIEIGSFTKLSPYVQLYTANYTQAQNKKIGELGTYGKKITIGKNVWIGAGSIILSGVKIGNNSIIGSLSLVNKNIPPNQLWAGNPAKFIKKLK